MSILNRNVFRGASGAVEALTTSQEGGKWSRIILGLTVPALLIAYAIYAHLSGKAFILTDDSFPYFVKGLQASYAALAYLGIAGFIHSHYFWGLLTKYRAQTIATWGRIVSCVVILFSVGSIFWRMFSF